MSDKDPMFAPYIGNGVSYQQGGPGDFDETLHGPVLDDEDPEMLSDLEDDDDL